MDFSSFPESCAGCPNRVVCRCLQVTEATVVGAIERLELRTIKEVQRHTQAGTGCTCCHGELREFLEELRPARAACA